MLEFCQSLKEKWTRRSDHPQFLILGLEQAGKTTLLYRLKLGQNWATMVEDLAEMRDPMKARANYPLKEGYDAGYHYEEFHMLDNCGIWDLPGTLGMTSFWSSVYNLIQVHGIFFVVDGTEVRREKIAAARQHIHTLMNEDALRRAFCVVIINNKRKARKRFDSFEDGRHIADNRLTPKSDMTPYNSRAEEADENHVERLPYRLGLHNLHESCEWRVKHFVIDCNALDGAKDPEWLKVLKFCQQTLGNSKGFGFRLS
mmetsp:Transcript_58861/g.164410  ORF Transcript_58861/g.164410 Transcript_58861/m.164410 type:complete len:257 (-) Transcript_58861:115-885(-)